MLLHVGIVQPSSQVERYSVQVSVAPLLCYLVSTHSRSLSALSSTKMTACVSL